MDDTYEIGAPFNMAIATLMSLRGTLDRIRDIEAKVEFPAEERQRIKIELVKRFYVDSSPLIFDAPVLAKFEHILTLKPVTITFIDRGTQTRTLKTKYDYELNVTLDTALKDLQIELQKKKYFMPPKDDMGTIGGKMS